MAELQIELLGSPALREKAEEIGEVDDELRKLIADMFDTMYRAEGIGLAGPQVGVGRRVIVVDVKEGGEQRMALINPRVLRLGKEKDKVEEGCLSIPGVSAHVERPTTVVVEALNEKGEKLQIEADGMLARCLLHEIDHLDGVLFIDYLSPLKRSMLIKKYRSQLAEEETAAGGRR